MRARVFLIILILSVIITLFIGISFGKRPGPTPTPAPTPETVKIESWQGVKPGITSRDELLVLLGPPASQSATGETLLYPSNNQYWQHQVSLPNNAVRFVREYLFAPADISLKNKLGAFPGSPTKLYGPDSLSGVYAFVLLDRGFGFVANEQKDRVYEVWYFAPSSLQQFLLLPEVNGYSLQPRNQPDI